MVGGTNPNAVLTRRYWDRKSSGHEELPRVPSLEPAAMAGGIMMNKHSAPALPKTTRRNALLSQRRLWLGHEIALFLQKYKVLACLHITLQL